MKTKPLLLLSILVLFFSCEKEPFELSIPITKIDTNSELFINLKQLSITQTNDSDVVCLTFIYPFNVYLYDNEGQITEAVIVNENTEFISLLNQATDDNTIGISYPINGTTESGNTISINGNKALKEAIEACIDDQIINYCNTLLEEENCVWKIKSKTENMLYNSSLMDFYDDGTGIFYHKGDAYRTSWISLFIEDQLHINIHLEGDSEVAKDWNFDWIASIVNDNTIQIENDEQLYYIKSNCKIENNCGYVEFRECATDDYEKALYVFDDYIDCITSFKKEEEITNVELSFFENIIDAEQELNKLETDGYSNKVNPQVIFVQTKDTVTLDSEITRIVLYAEPCNSED
ncbi:hypothetical protein [Aquimarina agarilytica]|uniref:hypothetical protein n=1 Tax=Aquimarina agarilytica TaxID=1087449 RepID=UPI0002891858|nr:hypothetical protein [Aquimarina agarilytica]